MEQQYKGFTVMMCSSEQRKDVAPNWRWMVVGEGFNPDGYATLNNAKGAITNHIKAQEAAHNAGVEILAQRWKEQDEQEASSKAASSDSAAYASVSIKGQQEAPQATQSRNKREGRFVGCCDGVVVRMGAGGGRLKVYSDTYATRTRKQRKMWVIRNKHK